MLDFLSLPCYHLFQSISVSLSFWYRAAHLLLVSFILADSNWIFSQVGYLVDSPTNSTLKQTPFGIPPLKVYEIALSKVLATQMGVTGAQHKSQLRV